MFKQESSLPKFRLGRLDSIVFHIKNDDWYLTRHVHLFQGRRSYPNIYGRTIRLRRSLKRRREQREWFHRPHPWSSRHPSAKWRGKKGWCQQSLPSCSVSYGPREDHDGENGCSRYCCSRYSHSAYSTIHLPIRQTLDKAYLLFFEFLESITLNELVYMESKWKPFLFEPLRLRLTVTRLHSMLN